MIEWVMKNYWNYIVSIGIVSVILSLFFKRRKDVKNTRRDLNVIQKLGDNYYTPAFFRMKVGSKASFRDLNKVEERVFMYYFHEYIHFLQDVTTTYGLMNISNTNYYIRDAVYSIEHGKSKLFGYPHVVKPKGDSGYLNHRMWRVYTGAPIEPMREKVTLDNVEVSTVTIAKQNVDVTFIDITDVKTGQQDRIVFGAAIMSEGMAYMMEHYVYEPVYKKYGQPYPGVPDYPYNICQKLAERNYPEIAQWPVVLVALCDLSLMNYNPGLMYVRLIEHLREIKLHERCAQYQKIDDFVSFIYLEGLQFLKGHQHDFDTMQKYVASEMKEYFKCKEFEGNNRWIDHVFNKGAEFRKKVPQFMIDIMLYGCGKSAQQNQCFAILFKQMGSPLVFNDANEATINPPEGFDTSNYIPELFWAIQQMFWMFQNGKKNLPCQLKNHCLISQPKGAAVVDSRCDTAPWSRCLDKQLCPFAVMWRHWGLTGYAPK